MAWLLDITDIPDERFLKILRLRQKIRQAEPERNIVSNDKLQGN